MDTHDQTYRSTLQRAAIVLAVVFQIGATTLPQFGIGEAIGSRSDDVRTLITPAGWAFAIWGPLFFGTVVFAIYQGLPAQHRSNLLDRIGWYAAGAFAGNGLWALYTQLADITAISAVIITATLLCLLAIYRTFAGWPHRFTAGERWCAVLPLSALAAWLTAATIVNYASTLTYYGVGGADPEPLLAAGVVIVGGLIASLAILRGAGNPWYAAVFLWALFGIYNGGGQRAGEVAGAAVAAAALVLAAAFFALGKAQNRARWFG